jgi:phosphatidylglycerophosphate synthase
MIKESFLYFQLVSWGPGTWIAWLSHRLGIRPNTVTLIGIALIIPAVALTLKGCVGWAFLVFHLFFFFDCADGILARATNQKSSAGAYLDDVAHELFHPAFLAALALRWHMEGQAQFHIITCVGAALANCLFRAHATVASRRLAETTRAETFSPPESVGKRLRRITLQSADYPNILVFGTLLFPWPNLLSWYFAYVTILSVAYVTFSAVRVYLLSTIK